MNRTTENIAISNSASKNVAASNTQKPIGEKQPRCKSVDVDNATTLAETAFVPNCTEERPRQTEEKLTELDEVATKEAQLMAFMGSIKITKGYFGDPKNGKHLVTLHSYEPVLKDGVLEYIRCEFRDREENNIWVHNMQLYKEKKGEIINNVEEKLTELSYSNRGILGGRTKDAFAILKSSFFYVWTVIGFTQEKINGKDVKGEQKVFTYFSEKSYDGACYFQQKQREKEANKEAEYRARKAAIADEEADSKQ